MKHLTPQDAWARRREQREPGVARGSAEPALVDARLAIEPLDLGRRLNGWRNDALPWKRQ